jgi:putative serine protease PepD
MSGRLVLGVSLLSVLLWGSTLQAEERQRQGRPFLGVLAEPAPQEGEQAGVTVREVVPGSPAAQAGLKSGDVIVKVGDQQVKDFDALINTIARHKPGDKLTFQVKREGKEQQLSVIWSRS